MIRDTQEAHEVRAPSASAEPGAGPPGEHRRGRDLDVVALRAAAELVPDRRAAGSAGPMGVGPERPEGPSGFVPRAPITVLCPHCSHACDAAAGIACVRCGAYVGAGIAELRRDDAAPETLPEPTVERPANDPGSDATGPDTSEAVADPETPDPDLLAGFAQIGRAATTLPPVAPRVALPAVVPPFLPVPAGREPDAPLPTEPFVVRATHMSDPATSPATLPGGRRFGRRPPGLHSSELPERHNWFRTVTTLVLLAAIAVIAGRIMFTEDPANEPILGSSAGAGVIDPTDRADARPASAGGETTLLQVHRVITSIARNGDGWSSVTPAAIGTSIDTVGVLGPERPPTRVDEVSLAIDPDLGVTLGAFDSDVAAGDCVWLRDTGNGPDVARDEGSGNCTAAAAPMAGWEPILP